MTKFFIWKKFLLTLFLTFALSLGLAVSTSNSAMAMDLFAAKAQGLVGERPDGLVGAVTNDAALSQLVGSTNAGRLATYQQMAQKQGVPLEQIQTVAGQELIGRTPAGQYIMSRSGQWVKK